MTPKQRRIVITLGFCGLVSAADNWFVSPALPAIANALAVLPSAAAIILAAYLVPYGLLQPVCGAIGDAVGRRRLLLIIVMGLSLSTFLCAAAPNLPLLVVARIVTGCFAAGIISVSQALVGDTVSERERGGAVGLLMGITFTGQGLSAGLGGIITDLIGWRAAFVAFGILGLIAWTGLLRLKDAGDERAVANTSPATVATAHAITPGNTDPAIKTSAAIAQNARQSAARTSGAQASGTATGTPAANQLPASQTPAASDAITANPIASFLTQALRTFFGRGRAVFLTACSTGIIYLGVYGFMGTFLAERCGLSPTAAGLLMMFYGVACLAGGTISGRIGAKRGLPHVILVGEASGIAAVAALALATATGSWIPALAAAAFLGLGYILVQPTLVSLSMDADPARTGLCTGLVGLGVFAGGGVGSAIGQTVIGIGGYLALWIAAGAALMLQIALSSRALSRDSQQAAPQNATQR